VDTDEKKQDWFLNGLNDGLTYTLEAYDFINFQDMVDKALVLENRRGSLGAEKEDATHWTSGEQHEDPCWFFLAGT
jgi:hypothetical protein